MASFEEAATAAFNCGPFGVAFLALDSDWTIWAPDLGVAPHVLSPTPSNMDDAKAAAVAYLGGSSKYRISTWNDQGVSATAVFVQGSD